MCVSVRVCVCIADGGETRNASSDAMPKIEILPSSDFSESHLCFCCVLVTKETVF